MGRFHLLALELFMVLAVLFSPATAQYALKGFSLSGDMRMWYDSAVRAENTVLLNGELFSFTRKSPNSHAFYEENAWRKTNIIYFGQEFRDVPALYDIEEDRLIIKNPLDVTSPILLLKEEVSAFEIGDNYFEFIADEVGFRTRNFYKIAYRGDSISLVYKIHKKLGINSGVLTYKVNYEPWLKYRDSYKQVTRFAHIKKLFPEHKRNLRQLMKQVGLRGRLDNQEDQKGLGQLVEYCDQLIKE